MNNTYTYTDQATVESFIGKEVVVTTDHSIKFRMEFTGILQDLNGKGYFRVAAGDEQREGLGLAKVEFSGGMVDAAWVAVSGNIIRIHA